MAATDTKARHDLQVRRVAGCIGADIDGVDLAEPLHPATIAALRDALHTHKVLFFRDQHLDHASHVALGEQFGQLTRRPGDKHGVHPDGYPQILTMDATEEDTRYGTDFEERLRQRWTSYIAGWHSDLTPYVNPPMASILRAERVPSYGGDTQWTNLSAAYAGLSEPLGNLVDDLHAEHAFFAGCQFSADDPDDLAVAANHAANPPSRHPPRGPGPPRHR
jgi:alpha-ketoglutarate-dependent taurine dioxygenase